jgi:hypothetical protein
MLFIYHRAPELSHRLIKKKQVFFSQFDQIKGKGDPRTSREGLEGK